MVTLDSVAAHANALTQFLRGVERRAAVFAQLQVGDPEHGDLTLEATIREFVRDARDCPEESWTPRFWAMLAASPMLEQDVLAPFWPGDLAPLARLEGGPRVALLLRLVAQLDDEMAAEVVGIDAASYRTVLQASLPQRPEGGADGPAWLAMRDEARYAIEDLTVDRLATIARVRDAVIAESAAAPPASDPEDTRGASRLVRALPGSAGSLASGLLERLRNGLRPS